MDEPGNDDGGELITMLICRWPSYGSGESSRPSGVMLHARGGSSDSSRSRASCHECARVHSRSLLLRTEADWMALVLALHHTPGNWFLTPMCSMQGLGTSRPELLAGTGNQLSHTAGWDRFRGTWVSGQAGRSRQSRTRFQKYLLHRPGPSQQNCGPSRKSEPALQRTREY